MSLLTPQSWHESASMNMTIAQRSHAKAGMQCEESRKAHQETVSSKYDMYNKLNVSLEDKVNSSQNLLGTLNWRADSLKSSIKHTCHSFSKLEAAFRAKHAPLQLCIWRIEQRKNRPLREKVRDIVENALEEEKFTLISTQNRLNKAMEQTKAMLAELESHLAEVRHDINQKGQALNLDQQCLRSAQNSFQSVLKHTKQPLPPSVSGWPSATWCTGDHDAYLQSSQNELDRQSKVLYMDKATSNKEEAAKTLQLDNDELIAYCQNEAEKALIKSERATVDRIEENQRIKERLDAEIKETDARIDQTNSTISETRFQIGVLQEPLALTSTCASLRKQRAMNEHIMDPVTTMICEKETVTSRAKDELVKQQQREKASLQELLSRRHQLAEDFKDKSAAQNIDQLCLRHGETLMRHGATMPLASGTTMSKFSRTAPLPSSEPRNWGGLSARAAVHNRFPVLPPLTGRAQTMR